MILVKRRTKERQRRESGGTDRACNINPFNKLIIDEIYQAFTVRGGGANVLHLSRGNSGYISGFAPLRLDLQACANEPRPRPRPASAMKRRRCRTMQQHSCVLKSAMVTRTEHGSWASRKIYPEMTEKQDPEEKFDPGVSN